MKFFAPAALAALATFASAQPTLAPRQVGDCPEAARFGGLSVEPSTAKVGEKYTLTNDLTCAPVKGIHPKFIDYFLEVPTEINNGHQPAIYLGRSTLDVSNTPAKDVLIGNIPFSATITSFPNSTSYVITSNVIYPSQGTDGSSVLIAGGTEVGITILSS